MRLLSNIAKAFKSFDSYSINHNGNDNTQEIYDRFLRIINESIDYSSNDSAIFDEIELFKKELKIIADGFINDNDLSKFKKIFKKENFDPHRFNLAFYSTDYSFIYFGDNNSKDTEEGFFKLLQNSEKDSIVFDVSVANHHATRRYAKRMYKFDGKIFFDKVYCSNGRGNHRYQKYVAKFIAISVIRCLQQI